jgi:hypothetical protein
LLKFIKNLFVKKTPQEEQFLILLRQKTSEIDLLINNQNISDEQKLSNLFDFLISALDDKIKFYSQSPLEIENDNTPCRNNLLRQNLDY